MSDYGRYSMGRCLRARAWSLLFCCALMGVGVLRVWGQEGDLPYTHRAWTVEDGLPQVSVNAIAQTPDGYLWLGTHGGLVRFDGVQFKVYNTANTPAIKSNRIGALAVDPQGRLWIGAAGHLIWWVDGTFQSTSAPEGHSVDLELPRYSGSSALMVLSGMEDSESQ